jgi:hypothetical protein
VEITEAESPTTPKRFGSRLVGPKHTTNRGIGSPRSLGKGDSAKEVIEIDPEFVSNIRVELRASGVTESVVYLDLDGLGREMS